MIDSLMCTSTLKLIKTANTLKALNCKMRNIMNDDTTLQTSCRKHMREQVERHKELSKHENNDVHRIFSEHS